MPLKPLHNLCVLMCCAVLALSCSRGSSASASRQEVVRKYAPHELQEDLDVLRHVLEAHHPSLYWYTSKDSMDMLFSAYRAAIRDSMTQQQFGFGILAPVTTAIRCGHTSFSFSKAYNKGMRGLRLPSFPLYVKVWGDSMILLGNLNRKDSLLKRGTRITGIDGQSVREITQTMFKFMPTDGYADNINYIRLSNAFPYYHRNIYGLKKNYRINYIDSLGRMGEVTVPLYDPLADTLGRPRRDSSTREPRPPRQTKSQKKNEVRSLKYIAPGDSTASASLQPGGTVVMTLNSFDGNANLSGFFRRSFRLIRERKAANLVIDIRSNGGGRVNHYTKLASYIRPTPFKVADSAFALRGGFGSHGKYFSMRTLNALALFFFTSKRADGYHHFRYWENHVVKPKKKDFFSGNTYIIISGPTFSASTLFAHTMKGQPNVVLIGEETGGGAYGNNGLMIPHITLPHTAMRVRMPLFRIVQYNHGAKDGRGVTPDIEVPPSVKALLAGEDAKMEKVLSLIHKGK